MKNALITAATKGIGRATAIAFANEGINLAICARNADDLVGFKEDRLRDRDGHGVGIVAGRSALTGGHSAVNDHRRWQNPQAQLARHTVAGPGVAKAAAHQDFAIEVVGKVVSGRPSAHAPGSAGVATVCPRTVRRRGR